MVRIKFMLGLAALVVMVGATSVAQAQNPNNDTLVTTFDGTTTQLGDNNCANPATDDCGVPINEPAAHPPPYTQCTATDGIGPLNTDTGAGCFRFNGNVPAAASGTCVFNDPTDPTETQLMCHGTIVSEGSYNNVVCGTGTVDGWATITTGVLGDDPINIDYSIVLNNNRGPLVITGDGLDGHGDGPGNGIIGGGVVSITPTPIGGCVPPTTATGFTVLGTMNITLPDNGPR
jgi:hypothetical protein